MHGKGVLNFTNGDVYEGEFANGQICGQGTMKTAKKGIVKSGIWEYG